MSANGNGNGNGGGGGDIGRYMNYTRWAGAAATIVLVFVNAFAVLGMRVSLSSRPLSFGSFDERKMILFLVMSLIAFIGVYVLFTPSLVAVLMDNQPPTEDEVLNGGQRVTNIILLALGSIMIIGYLIALFGCCGPKIPFLGGFTRGLRITRLHSMAFGRKRRRRRN
jgi:hypothetical protein